MRWFFLIVSIVSCYQLLSRIPIAAESYDNSQLVKLTKDNSVLKSMPLRDLSTALIGELDIKKSINVEVNGIYTKFSDIKRFSFVLPHYALGYDETDTLAAIFDLGYQNIRSQEFKERSSLGIIALDDIYLGNVVDVLRKFFYKAKTELMTFNSDENNFFDLQQTELALDYIDQNYGFKKAGLQGEFLEKFPLRSSTNRNNLVLLDIDFEQIMSPAEHEELLQAIENIESDIEELFEFETDLLAEIGVVKHKNNYELVLVPTNFSGANEEPMKVVDFRQENPSRRDLLSLRLKTNISDLGQLIPHPEVAALIQLSFQRYVRFHENQLSFHRWRAYEYISAAEKNESSPFYFLSDDEREHAGNYILSRESSIFRQLLKDETSDFLESLEQEQTITAENCQWANKNSLDFRLFTDVFAFAHSSSKELADAILALGDQVGYKKQPFALIDYVDPDDILNKRKFLYSMADALSAIILPLADANRWLTALYDILVSDTIRQQAAWEARLVSYLHSEDDDVRLELDLLYRQRFNPLELKLSNEEEFIYRSQQFLGWNENTDQDNT